MNSTDLQLAMPEDVAFLLEWTHDEGQEKISASVGSSHVLSGPWGSRVTEHVRNLFCEFTVEITYLSNRGFIWSIFKKDTRELQLQSSIGDLERAIITLTAHISKEVNAILREDKVNDDWKAIVTRANTLTAGMGVKSPNRRDSFPDGTPYDEKSAAALEELRKTEPEDRPPSASLAEVRAAADAVA